MINIGQKSQAEIEQEKILYDFGASLTKGAPMTVCKTYLIQKDGTKVDTRDLTEEQILGLIQNDLFDFSSDRGTYKTTGRIGLDSFKLIEELRKNGYKPSVNAILRLIQMGQRFKSIVMDLIGAFGVTYLEDARVIAQFQKELNGDFSTTSWDEVMFVFEQMAVNERNRNSAKRK